MLFAFASDGARLTQLAHDAPLDGAVWIDLYIPKAPQREKVAALGIEIPTLDEMEEIEVSNRLFRRGDLDHMTCTLPGLSNTQKALVGPVAFILGPTRLVTVRHHTPRSFRTFADRAGLSQAGCGGPERVFLGLIEEIVGRMADLLEGAGKVLDRLGAQIYASSDPGGAKQGLQTVLEEIGRQGELLGRVRLALLTVHRALRHIALRFAERRDAKDLTGLVKARVRDIQALETHADFLSSRVQLATDATLGMINLGQNQAVKSLSVVAALFLPPTLIASVFGMNFTGMDLLEKPWGYPLALGLMGLTAAATYLFFSWKKWL